MRSHLWMESNPSFVLKDLATNDDQQVKGNSSDQDFHALLHIVGITLLSIANLISWHLLLIMDRLWLLECFIFITAHLKSSCRFSMCDFDSEITVTSSIKAFIDETFFLLVVSSVLCSNISITRMKINGEITHPIIMPIFNFCQFEEYLALENLIYVHL